MRQLLLFSIFVITTFNLVIAQTHLLKGVIIDDPTSQVIPYATLEVKNKGIGVATNESGVFELSYSVDSLKADTLLFKALGYQDKEIAINKRALAIDSVKLSPLIFNLNTIIVKPNSLKIKKGMHDIIVGKEEQPSCRFTLGSQVAVFMDNEDKLTGTIESASFFMVKSNSKYKAPFRVRIYGVDKNGHPGKDLTTHNIIIQATKKNAWLKVDLSQYQISVPSDGYFIAMEWIYTKEKYYYHSKINKKKQFLYGQTLGLTIKSDKAAITYFGGLGKRWVKVDKENFGFTKRNALIRSTIAVKSMLKN